MVRLVYGIIAYYQLDGRGWLIYLSYPVWNIGYAPNLQGLLEGVLKSSLFINIEIFGSL
jgi:hypothetical protein